MTAYIRTRPNMDLVQFVPPPVCAVFVVSMDRDFVKEIGEFEVSLKPQEPEIFSGASGARRGGASALTAGAAQARQNLIFSQVASKCYTYSDFGS